MAFNFTGAAQIPLSVFGGQVTEMAPPNLPEGVSPDAPDVVFTPGGVRTRPGLKKVFAAEFPKGAAPKVGTLVWGKTYFSPNGGIENLYLDSNGFLWWEDVVNTPGAYTQIGSVTPGSYAKSVTAFGREYIAISDGQHGSDAALQWDGANLDRVTQDGPGRAPAVSNLQLPSVAMAVSGPAVPLVVNQIETTDFYDDGMGGGYYMTITLTLVAGGVGLNPGDTVTVAANAEVAFNLNWIVSHVVSDTVVACTAYFEAYTFGLGGTATPAGGVTAVRSANIVTIKTAAAHQLRPGYQAEISGLPAATIGTAITSIVINNADMPGIAKITTGDPHGLSPKCFVSITGVLPAVGANIAAVSRQGGIVTVETATAHKLVPGASFTLTGVTDTSFNTSSVVMTVVSPTGFTFLQTGTNATSVAGHIDVNWPIPQTSTPQYFEVIAAPTPTTFHVQMSYGDGTWITGLVSFAWDGRFYVLSVPSSTTFTYLQNGPDATTSTVGAVTPYGQISPGKHQVRVSFLTRNGYVTKPSPPAEFTAPGGQYVSLTDIPIGPPNVVGRILQFTGSEGAFFFYIPVAAQVNGRLVSTATQINDNATTSAILDFGDDTLFAALGTSLEGNDLASLEVIDGALGFGVYASRILAYGLRSQIQNLLNMGFSGGYAPSAPTVPAGWAGAGGTLVAGHFGVVWEAAAGVSISQPCYQDSYGAPILTGNTPYRFRCWAKQIADAPSVKATISSASTGFTSTVTLAVPLGFGSQWVEGAFDLAMPSVIPADMLLTVEIDGAGTAQIDDLSIVYDQTPYSTAALASYANNPESFDSVTGTLAPKGDTHPILDAITLNDTLYLLTQDPGGRLHRMADNGVTEPAFWPISQAGANCGVISAFATAKSQADDSAAGGGEEWFAWASSTGARIFSGSEPWKISQEIEPDWNGAVAAAATQWSSAPGINWAAQFTAWALNDLKAKRLYFGLPIAASAPNAIFVLDYRELDTAFQVWTGAPIHTSYSGRLAASDHARKWTIWHRALNGAALMSRTPGSIVPTFFGGNAQPLGAADGPANVFTLDPAKYIDDYYGAINSRYVTYFFPSRDQEQAMELGSGRKLVSFFTAFAAGVGNLTILPICDAMTNPWSLSGVRALQSQPHHDLEWGGGNALGHRIAFALTPSPLPAGTDCCLDLQRITVAMRPAVHLPVRGVA
jgi:hypothetical protein